VAEVSQQRLQVPEVGVLWRSDALELDEASEVIDAVEVDPHALVEEEPARFSDHSLDGRGLRSYRPEQRLLAAQNTKVTNAFGPARVRRECPLVPGLIETRLTV
jgi:hypothetical protein